MALRLVTFIDRLYDRRIPVRASGGSLGELFTPEMLRGGYRKKYLRATSRILALARERWRRALIGRRYRGRGRTRGSSGPVSRATWSDLRQGVDRARSSSSSA